MADIGVLPTKNTVRVTSSAGDAGTIPAASESAAGCMTAEQAKMLNALWAIHQTQAGDGSMPMVQILPPSGDYVTKLDLQMAMQRLGRVQDLTPVVQELRQQIAQLAVRAAEPLAISSGASTDGVDAHARNILGEVIEQMSRFDDRLREVEQTAAKAKGGIDIIKAVADQNSRAA